MNRNRFLYCLFIVALGLTACQPMATPEAENLEPAAGAAVRPTNIPASTHTPAPTKTATPTPAPTHTPVPPTKTPTPDLTATAQARIQATTDAQVARINTELQKYGLSTDQGRLGWIHDTLAIKVNTYAEEKIMGDYPDFTAGDFVLQTDLKWESKTGLAGCTVIMRSEDNLERGKQYRIYFMRLGGRPLWDIEYHRRGEFQSSVTGRILDANDMDSSQGATNRITIIAQGNTIAVYMNGERMGVFTDGKLAEGAIAFMAWQESGETTCTYSNTWLWVLDEAE